jgi:hypothetical protein
MNREPNANSNGQNPKPARPQTKGARVLSVVHGKDDRSLHLSPILQQIKDDGPALIDGELLKDGGAIARIPKAAANTDAKTGSVAPTVAHPFMTDKQVKVLLGFCAALTLGLSATLYFAWQQQVRLTNVEYMLEVLVTSPR